MTGGDWFERLFGFHELTGSSAAYSSTKAQFDHCDDLLTSKANGRAFQAGRFETPTLAELRARVGDLDDLNELLPGPLKVAEVVGDVSELHTDPANQFALFQAASQFNCLEFVGPSVTPEHGITGYAYDKTQGPACALACAPGTVVRNYFALEGKGQTHASQVENLRDTETVLDNRSRRYFRVRAGYTDAADQGLWRLAKRLDVEEGLGAAAMAQMRFGLQLNTEVTGSCFGAKTYNGPKQLVSQAYCSACSVAYSGASTAAFEALACLVLDAAYEATLCAAVCNARAHGNVAGSRKVFLTALGGGVFGNDARWIAEAMRKAFERFRGVGLEVILVSFGKPWPAFETLKGSWPAHSQAPKVRRRPAGAEPAHGLTEPGLARRRPAAATVPAQRSIQKYFKPALRRAARH